jgi:hypothetical protein
MRVAAPLLQEAVVECWEEVAVECDERSEGARRLRST